MSSLHRVLNWYVFLHLLPITAMMLPSVIVNHSYGQCRMYSKFIFTCSRLPSNHGNIMSSPGRYFHNGNLLSTLAIINKMERCWQCNKEN